MGSKKRCECARENSAPYMWIQPFIDQSLQQNMGEGHCQLITKKKKPRRSQEEDKKKPRRSQEEAKKKKKEEENGWVGGWVGGFIGPQFCSHPPYRL